MSRALHSGNWVSFTGSWFLLVMGTIGMFRGTLRLVGTDASCPSDSLLESSTPCPAESPEPFVVGLLLVGIALALSRFGASGLGVPAVSFAGPLVLGSQAIACLVAAFGQPGGPSVMLLCIGAGCATFALLTLRRSARDDRQRFLGTRRLDGGRRGSEPLPTRDASTLWLTWVLSVVTGIVFATALT